MNKIQFNNITIFKDISRHFLIHLFWGGDIASESSINNISVLLCGNIKMVKQRMHNNYVYNNNSKKRYHNNQTLKHIPSSSVLSLDSPLSALSPFSGGYEVPPVRVIDYMLPNE